MKAIDIQAAGRALPGAPPALLETLADRAAAEGLVDISYAEMDSPLGTLGLAVTARGLVRLSYTDSNTDTLELLARDLSPRIMRRPARTDAVRRQLDEYFNGRRHDFDTPLDWALVRGFGRRVLEATAAIPYGQVSTYQAIAREAGNPRASRATGNALGANPIPIIIPCHRVLRSGGGFGGYTGGIHRKEHLLQLEGARQARLPDL
ncbi:MAG TPA: methylated-DNA--[protein]-cysteine S-methyltransferase [Candidatus Dormibacteraeota bacterium]|nr:methylated-DNA--[protein]-cysteine S-methyltransferase [Candidatus Dormibacteraeota bacterium]